MPLDHLRDPNDLSDANIEDIEAQSLRCLYQAAVDFGFDAYDIFRQSTDDEKDVAEDITREMLDRLGGYQIQQRIYGNVDYRKARYVILPEYMIRQALFVDSKAEMASKTATLQMSQTSLTVHQRRGGADMSEPGKVPIVVEYNGIKYLTTTLLAHYFYVHVDDQRVLRTVTLAAIPNGKLQAKYNLSTDDSIWLAGRHAPTRGEAFRVRLSFDLLAQKESWRIQRISYDSTNRRIEFQWSA